MAGPAISPCPVPLFLQHLTGLNPWLSLALVSACLPLVGTGPLFISEVNGWVGLMVLEDGQGLGAVDVLKLASVLGFTGCTSF